MHCRVTWDVISMDAGGFSPSTTVKQRYRSLRVWLWVRLLSGMGRIPGTVLDRVVIYLKPQYFFFFAKLGPYRIEAQVYDSQTRGTGGHGLYSIALMRPHSVVLSRTVCLFSYIRG